MGGASSFDHNRLLRDIAASHLEPLGLKQRGRTRTWISDEQFWIGVVEFQPSQWGRGSYLNVGPMWLWQAPSTPKVFADVAGRTTPLESTDQFEAADDEATFRDGAERLARHAVECIVNLRSAITSYEDAARVAGAPTLWMHPRYPDLHSGIAAGMAGDWETSETQLTAYVERMRKTPDESLEATISLLGAVRTDDFAAAVQTRIEGQRRALKLPAKR